MPLKKWFRGQTYEVVYFVLENGDCPAETYLNAMQSQDYKKLVARVQRSADHGIPRNTENAREFVFSEGGASRRLRELKIHAHRITWDWGPRGEIVLLHAFAKKSDATSRSDLRRAAHLSTLLEDEGEARQ